MWGGRRSAGLTVRMAPLFYSRPHPPLSHVRMRQTRTVLTALSAPQPCLAFAHARPAARPASLGLQANITFLYYRDIPSAQRFYEDVLGLTLTVDQGYSKIYRVSETSYVGLVDESQGLHRASP